jgi:hypothetical protein
VEFQQLPEAAQVWEMLFNLVDQGELGDSGELWPG